MHLGNAINTLKSTQSAKYIGPLSVHRHLNNVLLADDSDRNREPNGLNVQSDLSLR